MNRLCVISVVVLSLLCSCSNNEESHYLAILHPNILSHYCWADDTEDSLVFATMDTWKAQLSKDWIRFAGAGQQVEGTVVNDNHTRWIIPKVVEMDVNKTDSTRLCHVYVTANGVTVTSGFIQYPIFHFTHPDPYITGVFASPLSMNLLAQQEKDSISFVVKKSWTLEKGEASDWLTLSKASGAGGEHKVYLTFSKSNGIKRQASLTLSSSGVMNKITVTQDAQ